MFREQCQVLENKKVAPGHYILKLFSPRISKAARPGQFVQIVCGDSSGLLLPRPFSFLTVSKKDFSILYQVVGKGTAILSEKKKGESLWILGPLGNGFNAHRKPLTANHGPLILVGGGVGIPPLYYLAEKLTVDRTTSVGSKSKHRPQSVEAKNIHVFLGARNNSLLLCEKEFKKLGVTLHLVTDDGSKGRKGFVTEILEEYLKKIGPQTTDHRPQTSLQSVVCSQSSCIYTCGPTPMLKAVSLIAQKYHVPCEVSVEVPMACGFGACLGCAIKVNERVTYGASVTSSQPREFILRSVDLDATKDLKGHRFAMACTEGPVFQASEIVWE